MHIEKMEEGETLVNRAKKTLALMDTILEEVKDEKGIDLLSVAKEEENMSFKKRAENIQLKHKYSRIKWFYEDIKKITESGDKISEFDAAKRIGMGTILGNRNQRLMNLKTITVGEFKKIKQEFVDLLKKTDIPAKANPDQSYFRTQFSQKDFLEGLTLCESQFELFETLVAVGHGSKVVISELANINPYFAETRLLSFKKNDFNSADIINNFGSLPYKIDENKSDTVNTILPLFSDSDSDIAPVLQTRLFQQLMTYNLLKNADALNAQAYPALLASNLAFLFAQKQLTEAELGVLAAIHSSLKLYFSKNELELKFQENLIKDPFQAVANDETQKKMTQVSVLRAILHAFYLHAEKKVSADQLSGIFQAIIYFSLRPCLRTAKSLLSLSKIDFEKVESTNHMETIRNALKPQFAQFKTLG